MTRKPSSPDPVVNPVEAQRIRRQRALNKPVIRKDLRPIVLAIRDIQQQLSITPLLRLRVIFGADEGDDDFNH